MTDLPIPANAGVFERALAAAMADDLPIEYAAILDPYRTPAEFLPSLAAQYSVDLWFDDWPDDRKREMIAQCAGRSVLYPDSPELAALKGTLTGLKRYLAFVDGEVVDRMAYPAHFVWGKSSLSFTPLQHPPFQGRYLIRIPVPAKPNAFRFGYSAWGKSAFYTFDRTPLERAKAAARIAKFEHVEYLVSFAHRRRVTLGDDVPFDDAHQIGDWCDRNTLGR